MSWTGLVHYLMDLLLLSFSPREPSLWEGEGSNRVTDVRGPLARWPTLIVHVDMADLASDAMALTQGVAAWDVIASVILVL